MFRKLALSVAAAGLLSGVGIGAADAAAVNAPALAQAAAADSAAVTPVRWVCGPYGRCVWRPGPRWGGPRWHGRRCWVRYTPWGPRRVCRVW